MTIVPTAEALTLRSTLKEGSLLWDRMLSPSALRVRNEIQIDTRLAWRYDSRRRIRGSVALLFQLTRPRALTPCWFQQGHSHAIPDTETKELPRTQNETRSMFQDPIKQSFAPFMSTASHRHSFTSAQSPNLPSPGQEALLRACVSPPEQFAQHWLTWKNLQDIENLEESSNRLLPLLFREAEKAKLIDPEMGRLRGVYRYHWCRNQLLLTELRRIISALNSTSIEVILLKGAAMIQQYYGDPALRPMSDLDIMVRPEKFEETSKKLCELGYVQRFAADFEKIRSGRLTHAIEFTRTVHGQRCEIDLHWTPLHRATWPGAEESFWEHSVALDFKGTESRTFDATHQLLHVCLHGALWNALPPLRWVTDAMWILRKDAIDWHRLIEHARALNGLQLLKNSLNYIHDNFDAPVPKSVINQLNKLTPSRFEKLEFTFQTTSSSTMRIDQLLVLGWMNHSRAFQGVPLWRVAIGFPNYLKTACKLNHWGEAPAYLINRILKRSQEKNKIK